MANELNCTPGNYQCGGRCLSNKYKCINELDLDISQLATKFAGTIKNAAQAQKFAKEQLGGDAMATKANLQNDADQLGISIEEKAFRHVAWWKAQQEAIANSPDSKNKPIATALAKAGEQKANKLQEHQLADADMPESAKALALEQFDADKAQHKTYPTSTKEVLGQGAFGKVKVTPQGTALKIGEIGQNEIEHQKAAARLGLAMPIYGSGKDNFGNWVEMRRLASDVHTYESVSKLKQKDAYLASGQLQKDMLRLHQAGIVHGDFHDGNFAIGPDNATQLLDFGYSKKIGDEATAGNYALAAELLRMQEFLPIGKRSPMQDAWNASAESVILARFGTKEEKESAINAYLQGKWLEA